MKTPPPTESKEEAKFSFMQGKFTLAQWFHEMREDAIRQKNMPDRYIEALQNLEKGLNDILADRSGKEFEKVYVEYTRIRNLVKKQEQKKAEEQKETAEKKEGSESTITTKTADKKAKIEAASVELPLVSEYVKDEGKPKFLQGLYGLVQNLRFSYTKDVPRPDILTEQDLAFAKLYAKFIGKLIENYDNSDMQDLINQLGPMIGKTKGKGKTTKQTIPEIPAEKTSIGFMGRVRRLGDAVSGAASTVTGAIGQMGGAIAVRFASAETTKKSLQGMLDKLNESISDYEKSDVYEKRFAALQADYNQLRDNLNTKYKEQPQKRKDILRLLNNYQNILVECFKQYNATQEYQKGKYADGIKKLIAKFDNLDLAAEAFSKEILNESGMANLRLKAKNLRGDIIEYKLTGEFRENFIDLKGPKDLLGKELKDLESKNLNEALKLNPAILNGRSTDNLNLKVNILKLKQLLNKKWDDRTIIVITDLAYPSAANEIANKKVIEHNNLFAEILFDYILKCNLYFERLNIDKNKVEMQILIDSYNDLGTWLFKNLNHPQIALLHAMYVQVQKRMIEEFNSLSPERSFKLPTVTSPTFQKRDQPTSSTPSTGTVSAAPPAPAGSLQTVEKTADLKKSPEKPGITSAQPRSDVTPNIDRFIDRALPYLEEIRRQIMENINNFKKLNIVKIDFTNDAFLGAPLSDKEKEAFKFALAAVLTPYNLVVVHRDAHFLSVLGDPDPQVKVNKEKLSAELPTKEFLNKFKLQYRETLSDAIKKATEIARKEIKHFLRDRKGYTPKQETLQKTTMVGKIRKAVSGAKLPTKLDTQFQAIKKAPFVTQFSVALDEKDTLVSGEDQTGLKKLKDALNGFTLDLQGNQLICRQNVFSEAEYNDTLLLQNLLKKLDQSQDKTAVIYRTVFTETPLLRIGVTEKPHADKSTVLQLDDEVLQAAIQENHQLFDRVNQLPEALRQKLTPEITRLASRQHNLELIPSLVPGLQAYWKENRGSLLKRSPLFSSKNPEKIFETIYHQMQGIETLSSKSGIDVKVSEKDSKAALNELLDQAMAKLFDKDTLKKLEGSQQPPGKEFVYLRQLIFFAKREIALQSKISPEEVMVILWGGMRNAYEYIKINTLNANSVYFAETLDRMCEFFAQYPKLFHWSETLDADAAFNQFFSRNKELFKQQDFKKLVDPSPVLYSFEHRLPTEVPPVGPKPHLP